MATLQSEQDYRSQFLVDRYHERDSDTWEDLHDAAERTSRLVQKLARTLVDENDRIGDDELTALYRMCQHSGTVPVQTKQETIKELGLRSEAVDELVELLDDTVGSVGGRQYTLYVGGQDEEYPEVETTLRDQLRVLLDDDADTEDYLVAAQEITELDYFEVRSGRMSPILHYLVPELFPVINTQSMEGMQQYFGRDIDVSLENYLEERQKYQDVRDSYDFHAHFRDLDWFFVWAGEDDTTWTQATREGIDRNVWQIQPGEIDAGYPESLWPIWREHGVISVGWDIGPTEELNDDLGPQSKAFARQMNSGDIVVAKHGHHDLLGIGVLQPDGYRYVPDTDEEIHIEGNDSVDNHPCLRSVDWLFTVDLDDRIDTSGWDMRKRFVTAAVTEYNCYNELRYKLVDRYNESVLPALETVEQRSIRLAGGSDAPAGYRDSYTLPVYKFLSNDETREECFSRPLFGGNSMPEVEEGDTLILYDFDQKMVYGPFKADADLQENYDEEAWSNASRDFTDQVPVKWTQSDLHRLSVDGPPAGGTTNEIWGEEAEQILQQLRTEGTPIRINEDGSVEERPEEVEEETADSFTEALESAIDPNQPAPYHRAIAHLVAGKNVVFYGPPGSGKTRLADRLTENFCAEQALETANAEWTRYDIVGGPAPAEDGDGFEAKQGIFTAAAAACQKHLQRDSQPVWLIIDELNRANLDQAFGEVFTQLDLDYRGEEHALPIDDVQVPLAFRLIATMNTSDQAQLFSLGYAFRRRFAFVHVPSLLQSEDTEPVEIPSVDSTDLVTPGIDKQRVRSIVEDGVQNAFELTSSLEGDTPLGLPQLVSRLEAEDSLPDRPTVEFALERDPLQADEVDSLDVLLYLSWLANNLELVELGQGLLIDAAKYLTTQAVIDQSLTWANVDQAVRAYLLPQFDSLMPELRKSEVSATDSDLEANLETYIEELESLNLTESARALRQAQETKRVI